MAHLIAGVLMGALYGLLLVWIYSMVTVLLGGVPYPFWGDL